MMLDLTKYPMGVTGLRATLNVGNWASRNMATLCGLVEGTTSGDPMKISLEASKMLIAMIPWRTLRWIR